MKKEDMKDLAELKVLFVGTDKKQVLAQALLDKAIFMEDTLQKLQKEVNEKGVVTSMCQGKYDIDRTNPSLQAYNNLIKNYTSVIKQLNDMLPTKTQTTGFDDFGGDMQ